MANFNKPELTSTYTNFITELKARDNTISSLFSDGTTHTGTYPVRAIRWNASNGYFERRNAANNAFERLEGGSGTHKFVNVEAKNITATGDANSTVSGVNINASGQSQAARFNVTGNTAPANGIYLPSANEISFTTNSTPRLTIESNGEVGIGTVDPQVKLEVVGDGIRLQNGTGGAFFEIGAGGSGNRLAHIDFVSDDTYTDYSLRILRGSSGANANSDFVHRGTGEFALIAQDGGDILLKTSNTTRFCVDSGGNIGIGNFTNPSANLHFYLNNSGGNYIRFQNTDGNAYIRGDNDTLYLDADVFDIRSESASSHYCRISSSLFDIKTAAKVNGNLEVTGTINATINGTTSQANDINIDERNNAAEYQVTFSDTNGTGYQRQYIDSDDTHFRYNPSTVTLSGLNINCTNLTATGTVSVTASNSSQLGGKVLSATSNRYDVVPFVASDGVMEIGFRLDFHTSDGSTQDLAGSLECDGNFFKFNKSVIPISGSHSLGSSSAPWQNLYINDLNMSNKGKTNDVDGTWGDYTIQEGHEDLYLLNHRTGKKFKFALIPVAN